MECEEAIKLILEEECYDGDPPKDLIDSIYEAMEREDLEYILFLLKVSCETTKKILADKLKRNWRRRVLHELHTES